MLVYPYCEGDDLSLAWQQHDVYGDALATLVRGCRQHVNAACLMLDLGRDDFWPSPEGVDHRTLQIAHDILAASWRYSARPIQADFFDVPPYDMAAWLSWLALEVRSWSSDPGLVAAVRRIVWFQNSAMGYTSEDTLRRALMERHDTVPWSSATYGRRQW